MEKGTAIFLPINVPRYVSWSPGPKHQIGCLPIRHWTSDGLLLSKKKQRHSPALNCSQRSCAVRDKMYKIIWTSSGEFVTTVMSPVYAVVLTSKPHNKNQGLTFDFPALMRGSDARLKIWALRASPWRTPSIGEIRTDSFPTRVYVSQDAPGVFWYREKSSS